MLDPTQIARLEALGGELLSAEPSRWGSYEILTPAGYEEKKVWISPGVLAELLDEWEADPERYRPRLAVGFKRWAAALATEEGTKAPKRKKAKRKT